MPLPADRHAVYLHTRHLQLAAARCCCCCCRYVERRRQERLRHRARTMKLESSVQVGEKNRGAFVSRSQAGGAGVEPACTQEPWHVALCTGARMVCLLWAGAVHVAGAHDCSSCTRCECRAAAACSTLECTIYALLSVKTSRHKAPPCCRLQVLCVSAAMGTYCPVELLLPAGAVSGGSQAASWAAGGATEAGGSTAGGGCHPGREVPLLCVLFVACLILALLALLP